MPHHPDARQEPIDRLLKPFQDFVQRSTAGAVLLLAATAIALVWANSRWSDDYHHLLETSVLLGFGEVGLSKPLHHWINDGLMGVFFFVVGLEIKREVLVGQLSSMRRAALPIFAAVGGMVVPAVLYLALNAGGSGASGWGVPMATDIAFALGVLALLGDRVPVSLKVFLTALAIVDDIGAILVIAVFYTESISTVGLLIAGLGLGLSTFANRAGVRSTVFYFAVGMVVWVAFLESGVHATLAAVLMAFTIPARTRLASRPFAATVDRFTDAFEATDLSDAPRLLSTDQQGVLHELEKALELGTAPLQRLEHALVPLVKVVVLPVFALANAGVTLDGGFGEALVHPVSLGVIVGLFVGKQAGILAFSWLAVRLGLADLPEGVGWRAVHGAAVLGGIGFTMAIFIATLGFSDAGLQNAAKVGTLAASLLSGVVGLLLLRGARG